MTRTRPITTTEQHRIRECLQLDPFSPSGLTWKVPHPGQGIKPGDRAGTLNTQKCGHQAWKVVLDGRQYLVHNIVWLLLHGVDPATKYPLTIDHIDRNGRNNDPANLRLATKRQQIQNRGNWGVSKFRGVYWDKQGNKWRAQWWHPITRKKINLGSYTDERQAFKRVVQARFLDYAARKRED